MDLWIKVFLINWIIILFTTGMDKHFFGNIGDDLFITNFWGFISLASIPALLVYLIIKYT